MKAESAKVKFPRFPSLGDDVIYTDHPVRKGDPVGQDRAAKIADLVGDGENAHLVIFMPRNINGGPTSRATAIRRNVPHHEPTGGQLPELGTYRFPPKPIGG